MNPSFWKHVVRGAPHECWLWTGAKCEARMGYGHYNDNSRIWRAHRYAWHHLVGPIPPGACLLHSCDTPACVNPAHLRIGTRQENMRDAALRGRTKKKLSARQAQALRAFNWRGVISQVELGQILGVSKTAVGAILRGHSYKHANCEAAGGLAVMYPGEKK